MLKMINSDVTEKVSDIERKYKGCKILVTEYFDDYNCNVTGKAYAISTDISSYRELQELRSKICRDGVDAVVAGYYGEGLISVQYEHR